MHYKKELSDLAGISFQEEVAGSVGNRWLSVVNFDPNHLPLHPYQVMRRLRQAGIETRPAWKPMHMQPLCAGLEFEPFSDTQAVSASLFLRSLCLPSGSNMTQAEQDRVIATLRAIWMEVRH
jgi:pyridoxal phosphate-dependent aminotransferase EpsN